MALSPTGTSAPRTHSPTTRRPSAMTVSTRSTCVPASDGPKVSMIRATIWRDAHRPHGCSGGRTALILRRVAMLTTAAPRDRMEPRFGTSYLVEPVCTDIEPPSLERSMSTTAIVDICQCQHWVRGESAHGRDYSTLRWWPTVFALPRRLRRVDSRHAISAV